MEDFSTRLRSERERLGMTQQDFAAVVGKSRKSQIRWESGDTVPDVAALSMWAARGVDVAYLLTGHRSALMPGATQQERSDIDFVIGAYLCLAEEQRTAMLSMANALVAASVERGTSKLVRKPSAGAESALPTSDEAQS